MCRETIVKRLSTALLLLLLPWSGYCQEYVETLEQRLEDTYGLERLQILHELIHHHTWSDSRKATRFGKQAQILAEDIFSQENALVPNEKRHLGAKTLILAGKAHYARGQYLDAQEAFQSARLKSEQIAYEEEIEEADEYLAKIDSIARVEDGLKEGFLKSTLKRLKFGEKTASSTTDFNISANLKLARHYENNQNYYKAIKHNEKAINYMRNKGDAQGINQLHARIAELYEKAGQYEQAITYYEMAIRDGERIGDTATLDSTRRNKESLYGSIDKIIALKTSDTLGLVSAPAIEDQSKVIRTLSDPTHKMEQDLAVGSPYHASSDEQTEDLRKLAQEFEKQEDFQKSLEYYKLYTELDARVKEEVQEQELALLDNLNQIEQREIQITNLKQQQEIQELELEEQRKLKTELIIGAILLFSLALTLYLLYYSKRKDHKKLQFAFGNLELTQGKLVKAEKRIKTLLTQQVSGAIADELLASGESDRKIEKKFVCVMFLDIRGFTPFAEKRSPEDIIKYQNDVFGFMIEIVDKHQGIIINFSAMVSWQPLEPRSPPIRIAKTRLERRLK